MKLIDDRQVVNRSALSSSIGSSANTSLNLLFAQIDSVMVNLSGTQTLTNKTLSFLKTNVITDSTTTGTAATIQAGDILDGVVRLTNGSLVSISGIPAGASGQHIAIENQTGNSISINNNDAGATAANRIFTGTGANLSMPANATFDFVYDTTTSRWMLRGVAATATATFVPTTKSFLETNYYTFTVTSANATIGATYTNNTQTFTVVYTISAGTMLVASATGAPLASGTLTKTTGTGDATITFSSQTNVGTYIKPTSPAPLYIEVTAVGGGGGGRGQTSDGSNGSDTLFGSSLLTAGGGFGGGAGTGGVGGTSSIGAGATGFNVFGGDGFMLGGNGGTGVSLYGGPGGSTAFGGAGTGGENSNGNPGKNNTGAGGGGQSLTNGTGVTGSPGGGAGGYLNAIVSPVSATYTFSVGAGGAGGAGTNSGGAGGSGAIIVKEYYQ